MVFWGDMSAVPQVCNIAASITPKYTVWLVAEGAVFSVAVLALYLGFFITLRLRTKVEPETNSSVISVCSTNSYAQFEYRLRVCKAISKILVIYIVCYGIPTVMVSVCHLLKLDIIGVIGPIRGLGMTVNASANIVVYSLKIPQFKIYFSWLIKWKPDVNDDVAIHFPAVK